MTTRRILSLGALFAVAVPTAAFYGCSHKLPSAPAHAYVAPAVAPVSGMKVCWLEYGRGGGPGLWTTAGPTKMKKFDATTAGLLIRHPAGDVLVDTGNSSKFKEEVARYPFFRRLYLGQGAGKVKALTTPEEALKAAGADPAALKWVVISHAHLDHAGGLVDLKVAPIFLPQEEIDFVTKHANDRIIHVVPEHAKAMEGRMNAIPFAPVPYATFDESFDVFGDGSVVLVKLSGHTPGSVGTFVNLSAEKRLFHVGDTVFTREAIEKRVPKGLMMAPLDFDADDANLIVAKLSQLHALDPALSILPAHDRPAWTDFFGKPGCVEQE